MRRLKRPINSLYFERSGLSAQPEKLAQIIHEKVAPQSPANIIKNIYAFEFLNIRLQPIVEESGLQTEHGDIGQLNTCLNYFKQEISEKGDNPPIGILLVAEKDHALVN